MHKETFCIWKAHISIYFTNAFPKICKTIQCDFPSAIAKYVEFDNKEDLVFRKSSNKVLIHSNNFHYLKGAKTKGLNGWNALQRQWH